jgi:very-short-patch-repair endonuclease
VDEVVRGHRRGAGWTAVGYGLHLRGTPSFERELRAWALVLPPGAVFTHLAAARLRGWWLPAGPTPVHVAVGERDRHPQRRGLTVVRLVDRPVLDLAEGLPVATAAETVLAAARDLDVLDLVPLADSALHLGHCTLEQLQAAARQRRRGAPRLRRVLPLLDGRSESAWESLLRLLHHAAEVEVEPQRRIEDDTGRFVARADLWLVGTKRLHEYDGEVHRDRDTHRADLHRDRRLVENGWQRLGWTATEVLRGGPVLASVDTLLGRPWRSSRLARWRAWVAASSWSTNR